MDRKEEKISDLEQKNKNLTQKIKDAEPKHKEKNATKIDGGNADVKIKADKLNNQSKPKK